MKHLFLSILFPLFYISAQAQSFWGSTGLLHMPTGDMQKDKTVLLGANMLNKNQLSNYWKDFPEYNPYTYNYYLNITMFPWLEIYYTCTLVKGIHNHPYWPSSTWGKFVNQDRAFGGRIRIMKESWLTSWMPQIVLGADDPGSHSFNGGGEIDFGGGNAKNHNFSTRFYLAATRHFDFKNYGKMGVHCALVAGRAMYMEHYTGVALGVDYSTALPEDGSLIGRLLNKMKFMAEYDARTINVGATAEAWRDRLQFTAELNNGKFFNAGIQYKIHLK